MYLSASERFLSAGKFASRGSSAREAQSPLWLGQSGGSNPKVIRSFPDIRMVVGRFLRTRAEIFLLGTQPPLSGAVSFVAQNCTPATGVTVSEFPRQTFGDLPCGNAVIRRLNLVANPSDTSVFVQPVSHTASTAEPG